MHQGDLPREKRSRISRIAGILGVLERPLMSFSPWPWYAVIKQWSYRSLRNTAVSIVTRFMHENRLQQYNTSQPIGQNEQLKWMQDNGPTTDALQTVRAQYNIIIILLPTLLIVIIYILLYLSIYTHMYISDDTMIILSGNSRFFSLQKLLMFMKIFLLHNSNSFEKKIFLIIYYL